MSTKYTPHAIIGAAVIAVIAALFFFIPTADAGITYQLPKLQNSFVNHTFFSATTTSATSTNATSTNDRTVRLDGAEKATFYFSRAWATGGNSGLSRFEVEVSPDGTNWYDFSRLYLNDAAKTASSTVYINAATSTTIASMDLTHDAYHFVRCIVVETTDGAHSCSVSVEY